jgi:hypothetical protein
MTVISRRSFSILMGVLSIMPLIHDFIKALSIMIVISIMTLNTHLLLNMRTLNLPMNVISMRTLVLRMIVRSMRTLNLPMTVMSMSSPSMRDVRRTTIKSNCSGSVWSVSTVLQIQIFNT